MGAAEAEHRGRKKHDRRAAPFSHGPSNATARVASGSEKVRREEPGRFVASSSTKQPYFAVPVRKRDDSDALFMGRISIGRARNKDIVLRHSSVSKFHAWFEADDSENLHLCDAGSTNLTHVNGQAGRGPSPHRRGARRRDPVRFDRDRSLFARAFWDALRTGRQMS